MATSSLTTKRGFLRALTALPLIGGGISLIGNPVAAAEPLTFDLLNSYDAWLHYERRILACALRPEMGHNAENFVPLDNKGGKFHFPANYDRSRSEAEAKGRASLVLSAVGCDWR